MFTPPQMYRELDDLRALMEIRMDQGLMERHLSSAADYVPALRVAIDRKIAALGTGGQDIGLGNDEFLSLIADLVEYRIALFNTPVFYYPTDDDEPGLSGEFPPLGAALDMPGFVIKHQGTKDNQ